MLDVVPRMSRTPGQVRHPGRPLGADNEEIFGEGLGYTPERLRAMREAGTIS
jgi:crotonobetainyl-CoA:carnitine CoA-transferase CaiB-like acyl-CoA transferase